jgi:hypothetical protein
MAILRDKALRSPPRDVPYTAHEINAKVHVPAVDWNQQETVFKAALLEKDHKVVLGPIFPRQGNFMELESAR